MTLAELITRPKFVFDVESIGLHGDPFAVGAVVMQGGGVCADRGYWGIKREDAWGLDSDRAWVNENIPALPVTCSTPTEMLEGFWDFWMDWKAKGAVMCADCAWPVEANFLTRCVRQQRADRAFDGPYPLIEISTIILAAGGDALATLPRRDSELPVHHPLKDALQSARVLDYHIGVLQQFQTVA